MKLRIATILFIAMIFTACKNEKTKTSEIDKTTPEKNDFFSVSFNLIVHKDDNFHLYYTEDGTINFNEKQSVWMPIKGENSLQEVVFKLPVDVVPTNVRVDFGFGKNETQSDVILKTFKMGYFDKKFEVSDSKIFDYFYPNKETTIIDINSNSLKRIKIDQQSGPSLYPHIALSEQIAKMTK